MKTITKVLSTACVIAISATATADEASEYNISENLSPATNTYEAQNIIQQEQIEQAVDNTYYSATEQPTEVVQPAYQAPQIVSSSAIVREVPEPVLSKVFADSYLGVQYTFSDMDLRVAPNDEASFDLHQMGIHGGVRVTDWFSSEFRYNFGTGDDKASSTAGTATYKFDESLGAYGLFGLPLDKYFNLGLPVTPYAVLGFTRARLTGDIAGVSSNIKDTDISWGLGARYNVLDNVSASLEYMNYIDNQDLKIDGINLALSYKF